MTKEQRPDATEKARKQLGALCVIALFPDGGSTAAWSDTVTADPEQLRMDLITAANNTQRCIEQRKAKP